MSSGIMGQPNALAVLTLTLVSPLAGSPRVPA